jgi:mannose/fructose/N-acetylgalactosamine-specific phosphotransferase system component IID
VKGFIKGHKKVGGKQIGSLNKTTKQSQELFMKIMNGQVKYIEPALKQIYEDDPEKYVNALSKLFQYFMPRKTDITSGDEKIQIKLPDIIIK